MVLKFPSFQCFYHNKKKVIFQTACDVYSKTFADKILGGEIAEEDEFPWMVMIKVYFNKTIVINIQS